MGCCGPSECCTFQDFPNTTDTCMCGCGYLNGSLSICTAQFFTLLGALLSLASLIDCSFVSIDPTTIVLEGEVEIDSIGMGFIFFQRDTGECYWYNDTDIITQLPIYWNQLGKIWVTAAGLSFACTALTWWFFLYSISFCCSSQVRQIRLLNGFMLAGMMTMCEACAFIVYGMDFCQVHSCSFSRGSATSIGAIVCFIMAGNGYFCSSDYPGVQGLNTDISGKERPWEDRYEDEILHNEDTLETDRRETKQ